MNFETNKDAKNAEDAKNAKNAEDAENISEIEFNQIKHTLPFLWKFKDYDSFHTKLEHLLKSKLTNIQSLDIFYTLYSMNVKNIWYNAFKRIFNNIDLENKIEILNMITYHSDIDLQDLKQFYNSICDEKLKTNISDKEYENFIFHLCFLNKTVFKPVLCSHLKSIKSIPKDKYEYLVKFAFKNVKSEEKLLFCYERLIDFQDLSDNDLKCLENINNKQHRGKLIDIMLRSRNLKLLNKAIIMCKEDEMNENEINEEPESPELTEEPESHELTEEPESHELTENADKTKSKTKSSPKSKTKSSPKFTSKHAVHYYKIKNLNDVVENNENISLVIFDLIDISSSILNNMENIYEIIQIILSNYVDSDTKLSIKDIFSHIWLLLDDEQKVMLINEMDTFQNICCSGFLVNILSFAGSLLDEIFIVENRDFSDRMDKMEKLKQKYSIDDDFWLDSERISNELNN